MNTILLNDLADIVGGTLHFSGEPIAVTGFTTDNREVKPGDLFIAIKGAKVDGHDFAADALSRGAAGVLAERPISGTHILVANVVDSLAKLGASYRNRYQIPVIGVTGSAGKTTTKEFLAAALQPLGSVLKTVGNRNTEYTAPLLWPEIGPETKAVVIELAMRGFGQISHLASFSRPTVGVITNIGWSHVSEVGSREGIAKAKSELIDALPEDGIAVLPADDIFFGLLKEQAGRRQVFSFGWGEEADCRLLEASPIGWEAMEVKGFFADLPWRAEVPTLGRHLAPNVAAAICTAVALGLAPQEAADAIADAELPPMRMEVLERNGVRILLDAYNASPASMRGALETFVELPCTGRRFAILGQMNELGDVSVQEHKDIGGYAAGLGFESIALFGELAVGYRFGLETASYEVNRIVDAPDHEALREFVAQLHEGDALFVKGSRSLELEKVVL